MKWFGEQWPSPELPAPICENLDDRIETPVGQACLYCQFPIQENEQGVVMPGVGANGEYRIDPVHRVCILKWTGIYSIVEGL